MSPTSVRRTTLQPTPGTPTTDLDQKKDQARARVKNIAVGVIAGLAIATAAYYGHGLIFGNTQPDVKSRMCELGFIVDSQTPAEIWNAKTLKHEPKVIPLPGSPEFKKAHSDFFNSEAFKKCLAQDPAGKTKDQIEQGKALMENLAKYCEADKTHWLCRA